MQPTERAARLRSAARSLIPRGLRWQLTAWVAAMMIVSAAVIFVVVYNDTGTQLRAQIDRDIGDDVGQLAGALRPLNGAPASVVASRAQSYVLAQPYSASSTLLFVLVGSERPVSNHNELFGGGRPEPGESAAQQAAEDSFGRKLAEPRVGYSTQPVPDVGSMRILERPLRLGRLRVTIGAGEPLALIASAQHGIAHAFVLAGALTLALALLLSYFAGTRVSRPLRRMAAVATRVDGGELEPRMDPAPGRGEEVHVLTEAFNHMLDRLEEAFSAQREFIGDASHELRTPLTVMRGQLEVLAAQPDPSVAEVQRVEQLVQAEITRISRLVDDLLLLAQTEQTEFLQLDEVDLPTFVDELWDGISLTAERRYELSPVPAGTLRADPDRLAQALRNLIRNAVEHTQPEVGLVALDVSRMGASRISFVVRDDGPGIPPEQREPIFERFHRTDPARTRAAGGAGLGLAIVLAIAEAHGGSVRATEPPDGLGGRVEFVLPGFEPA